MTSLLLSDKYYIGEIRDFHEKRIYKSLVIDDISVVYMTSKMEITGNVLYIVSRDDRGKIDSNLRNRAIVLLIFE